MSGAIFSQDVDTATITGDLNLGTTPSPSIETTFSLVLIAIPRAIDEHSPIEP